MIRKLAMSYRPVALALFVLAGCAASSRAGGPAVDVNVDPNAYSDGLHYGGSPIVDDGASHIGGLRPSNPTSTDGSGGSGEYGGSGTGGASGGPSGGLSNMSQSLSDQVDQLTKQAEDDKPISGRAYHFMTPDLENELKAIMENFREALTDPNFQPSPQRDQSRGGSGKSGASDGTGGGLSGTLQSLSDQVGQLTKQAEDDKHISGRAYHFMTPDLENELKAIMENFREALTDPNFQPSPQVDHTDP